MTSAAIEDVVVTRGSRTELDARRIVGTWRCTNRNTTGIPRFTIRAAGGKLYLQVTSVRDGQEFEWGEREVTPYAHEFGSNEVFAFTTDYDFGFQRIHVQAVPRRGVMVFGTLVDFTDDSGRIGGFVREFYYRDRS